jgi:hypothetical protein
MKILCSHTNKYKYVFGIYSLVYINTLYSLFNSVTQFQAPLERKYNFELVGFLSHNFSEQLVFRNVKNGLLKVFMDSDPGFKPLNSTSN